MWAVTEAHNEGGGFLQEQAGFREKRSRIKMGMTFAISAEVLSARH